MRNHRRLPTLRERRATMRKINDAERAMLPQGVAQDLIAVGDTNDLRALYENNTPDTEPMEPMEPVAPAPHSRLTDYLLAGFALALILFSVTQSIASK